MNVQTSRFKLRVSSKLSTIEPTYQVLHFKVQTSLQISFVCRGERLNGSEGEGCVSLDCQMIEVSFAEFVFICPPLNGVLLHKELTIRETVLTHKTRMYYYTHMQYIHFPIHNFKFEFLWGLHVRPQ
jgi:hypothetical protein